jgi:hypothetical protein
MLATHNFEESIAVWFMDGLCSANSRVLVQYDKS